MTPLEALLAAGVPRERWRSHVIVIQRDGRTVYARPRVDIIRQLERRDPGTAFLIREEGRLARSNECVVLQWRSWGPDVRRVRVDEATAT